MAEQSRRSLGPWCPCKLPYHSLVASFWTFLMCIFLFVLMCERNNVHYVQAKYFEFLCHLQLNLILPDLPLFSVLGDYVSLFEIPKTLYRFLPWFSVTVTCELVSGQTWAPPISLSPTRPGKTTGTQSMVTEHVEINWPSLSPDLTPTFYWERLSSEFPPLDYRLCKGREPGCLVLYWV